MIVFPAPGTRPQGLSVSTSLRYLAMFRPLYHVEIQSGTPIPKGLDILNNGIVGHYVIVPTQRMNIDDYRSLMNSIAVTWSVDYGDRSRHFDPEMFTAHSHVETTLAEAISNEIFRTHDEPGLLLDRSQLFFDLWAKKFGEFNLKDLSASLLTHFSVILRSYDDSLAEEIYNISAKRYQVQQVIEKLRSSLTEVET